MTEAGYKLDIYLDSRTSELHGEREGAPTEPPAHEPHPVE